jgi:hypothetical protein
MHGETTPNLNSVGTNESIARIRVDGTGKVSFRINSFSFAYPWGGEACFFSEWQLIEEKTLGSGQKAP